MPPLQQRYHDLLMQKVRSEEHPSHRMLDKIEQAIITPEQVIDYTDMLLDKLEASRYPSPMLLERIEAFLHRMAVRT